MIYFNFIGILKVKIWSLSIDLTGYKSPISKSKVGVLGFYVINCLGIYTVEFGNLVFLTFYFPSYNFYHGLSHIEVTKFSVHFVILVI